MRGCLKPRTSVRAEMPSNLTSLGKKQTNPESHFLGPQCFSNTVPEQCSTLVFLQRHHGFCDQAQGKQGVCEVRTQ